MKSQFTIVLAFLLFALVSVAQEAPKATKTTTAKSQSAPAAPAKPGAKESTRALTDNEKRGYALGVQVGTDIAKGGIEADRTLLLQGMRDVLNGRKLRMTMDDLNATLSAMQKEQHEKTTLVMKEFAGKNKKDGEAFLAST